MDRHDGEIDRVLAALGAAEPSAGMKDRVLVRLSKPAVAVAKTKTQWAWGAGTVAGLAGLALLTVILPRPAHKVPLILSSHKPTEVPALLQMPPVMAKVHRASPVGTSVAKRTAPELAAGQAPSRGLADLPSMLAPPASITEQEHQLAQLARGPDQQSLTILNAAERDRLSEQSAAEFKQFFPPPTPQEIYLAEHTPN